MVKVSVIVPVYNVEKYLRKCLDSLVNQTLKDIEIIVVNDASPDNSREIMEEYREKYSNIKNIYNEKNRGLGGARNAGIQQAIGKYITFVDSDDYVESDYCEKMYTEIENTGSDVAYGVFRMVNEEYEMIGEKLTYPKEFAGELTVGKKKGIINKPAYACGKLFKLDLWKKIELTFPENLRYEDAPTVPIYMLHAKKSCCVEGTYYNYLIRNDSIFRSRNGNHQQAQTTALLFVERMKKYGLYDEYIKEIEHFMVERYYCIFLKRCVTMYDEISYIEMEKARDEIRKWYPEYEKNPYHNVFVAEDRIRMAMNEVSPHTCALWEIELKKEQAKDMRIYGSVYYSFYEEKKEKIKNILGEMKNIVIYGDKYKRYALADYMKKYFADINVENVECEEVLIDCMQNKCEAVICVNPGIGFKVQKAMDKLNNNTKIINLEDILYGYIEE